EIFSNPLFEEEIISTKIDPHHFDAESDLIESMLNHDSFVIPSSLKINSLLDEFVGELTLLKSIPSRINETNCYSEEDIHLIERLLYNNSSPRPPEEFVSDNSDADIESFSHLLSPLRIVTLEKSPDLLSHRGLEIFKLSAKCLMRIHGKNIPTLDVPLFYFYPLDQLNILGNVKTLAKGIYPPSLHFLSFS
nr:hypothetical protein [Tanacetum cinerariifolium]